MEFSEARGDGVKISVEWNVAFITRRDDESRAYILDENVEQWSGFNKSAGDVQRNNAITEFLKYWNFVIVLIEDNWICGAGID